MSRVWTRSNMGPGELERSGYTKAGFVPRVCAHCGKAKGTTAFRYQDANGQMARGYYHPDCFRKAHP